MSKITEEEIKKILPAKGPSFEEVKKYLDKYNKEYIVIKCGGSVLVDQNLFKFFIEDVAVLKKLGFNPIVIHGGGKRINYKLSELDIKSDFKELKRFGSDFFKNKNISESPQLFVATPSDY